MHVGEDDHLVNGGDGDALDLLAVLAEDEVLAALADVGAWFLEIEDDAFVALGA